MLDQSGEVRVTGVLIVTGLIVGFLVFDRLMLAAERRGWVRWRRSPPTVGSASTALLEILSLYEPAHKHIVQERRATDAEEAGDDDPIDPLDALDDLRRHGPDET